MFQLCLTKNFTIKNCEKKRTEFIYMALKPNAIYLCRAENCYQMKIGKPVNHSNFSYDWKLNNFFYWLMGDRYIHFKKLSAHINIFILVRRKNVPDDNLFQATIRNGNTDSRALFLLWWMWVLWSETEQMKFTPQGLFMICCLLRMVACYDLSPNPLFCVVSSWLLSFCIVGSSFWLSRIMPGATSNFRWDSSVSGTLSSIVRPLSQLPSKEGSLRFLPVLYLLIRSFVFLLWLLFDLPGLRCLLHDSSETVERCPFAESCSILFEVVRLCLTLFDFVWLYRTLFYFVRFVWLYQTLFHFIGHFSTSNDHVRLHREFFEFSLYCSNLPHLFSLSTKSFVLTCCFFRSYLLCSVIDNFGSKKSNVLCRLLFVDCLTAF